MLLKYWKRGIGIAVLLTVSVCFGIIGWIQFQARGLIFYSPADVQAAPVALILGASVKQDGTASDALRDRVMSGVDLFRQGKVTRLLMSGDDGQFHINEVASMRKLALEAGIPEAAIMTDGHGYRTYESCKRAVKVFGITSAIVVTQRFHLSRALYLCSHLGLTGEGLAADRQTYQRIIAFTLRDYAASLKAWWDIHIFPPSPPVAYTE